MRWATFDCYGTLVDWNSGIRGELTRLFGDEQGDALLARYHELEPEVQRTQPTLPYGEVMATVLDRLAEKQALDLAPGERDSLGRSLPSWPVFPEVPQALAEAREHGWSLAILSNTDREFIEASMQAIGVPFDFAIVASEIGSYKPAHRHWQAFYERSGAQPDEHVHVAQSHFHDIVPAHELGIRSVWINRLGERGDPPPTRELRTLAGLSGVLDELVPAA